MTAPSPKVLVGYCSHMLCCRRVKHLDKHGVAIKKVEKVSQARGTCPRCGTELTWFHESVMSSGARALDKKEK